MNNARKTTDNFVDIFNMEPIDLALYLQENYISPIPTMLSSTNELQKAGNMLGELANIYSYLMSMSTFAKLKVREEKRKKSDKLIIDNAVDRRDILNSFAETVKMQYTAISRMITVKKQVDEEINMI